MGKAAAKFYASSQLRELDRRAIEDYGIPGYTLMQRAAAAAWRAAESRWPQAKIVHVVAGAGNNGGDGYEIARRAKSAGREVHLWRVGEPGPAEARQAFEAWRGDGGETHEFREACLAGAQVVVDALLGIGVRRPLEGVYATAVEAIKRAQTSGAHVLAVDVPSGLDSDCGRVWGCAVRADLTVTFIGRKLGLCTGAGPDCAGEVVFDALGVPDAVYERVGFLAEGLDKAELVRHLPPRSRGAHKGRHGHVLIVGGDEGMGGAVLMAARAALRAGSGLVSIATHPAHASHLIAAQPELMGRGVRNARELAPLLQRADVVALGPGLGQGDWGRELWAHLISVDKPLVLDADGLNWLAANPQRRGDWILTPHPGEAARLLGVKNAEIQNDRPRAAALLQERYGGVVVLKGAGSLVRGQKLALCTHGNAGMAVGGMGDVLTGAIAGLRAQGLDAEAAARCGVLMHALAGDRAARGGERGLLPGDVVARLRRYANP